MDLVSEHQPVEVVSKVMSCPSITKIGEETSKEMKKVSHHVTRFVYNVNCNKKQIEALLARGNRAKRLGCPKKVRIRNNNDVHNGECKNPKWLYNNKISKCAESVNSATTAANGGEADNDKVLNPKSETSEKELVKDRQASAPVVFGGIKSKSKDPTGILNDKHDKKCHVETVPFNEHVKIPVSHVYGNTDCIDVAEEKVLIYNVNNDINCEKFLASIVPNSMRPILTGEIVPTCDSFVK